MPQKKVTLQPGEIPQDRDTLVSASWGEQIESRKKAAVAAEKNAVWLAMRPLIKGFAEQALATANVNGPFEFHFQDIPERRKEAPTLVKSHGRTMGVQLEIQQGGKTSTKAHQAVGEALVQLMESPAFTEKDIGLFGHYGDSPSHKARGALNRKTFPQHWGGEPASMDYSLNLQIEDQHLLEVADRIAEHLGDPDLAKPVHVAFRKRACRISREEIGVACRKANGDRDFIAGR